MDENNYEELYKKSLDKIKELKDNLKKQGENNEEKNTHKPIEKNKNYNNVCIDHINYII